ncbi:MAG: YraN family protein [Oceanicoccus sp.]
MLKNKYTNGKNTNFGADIEKKACQWLQRQGLTSLEVNYRCKTGEIDIIMLDDQQLVFVEVRYRKSKLFGDGLESVDWRKQQKLQKAAAHFLMVRTQFNQLPCRFDVIAASPDRDSSLHWSWVKDAFTL